MRDSARGEGGGGRAGGGVEPAASCRSRDPSQQPGRERRFPAVASLNRAPANLLPVRRGSSGLGWAMIFPNSSSNSAGGSRTPYRKQVKKEKERGRNQVAVSVGRGGAGLLVGRGAEEEEGVGT